MSALKIKTPLSKETITSLKVGDEVFLSGTIYTARDAAHKKICDLIVQGKKIKLNLKNAVIYYAGPTPAGRGMAVGSCGPTTASRMDPFAADMLKMGVNGMIGKGNRSSEVVAAIKKYKAVYFLATGGIGALLATKIKTAKPVLFKELGTEAVHEMEIEDFPLIVGIDSKGNNIYAKT